MKSQFSRHGNKKCGNELSSENGKQKPLQRNNAEAVFERDADDLEVRVDQPSASVLSRKKTFILSRPGIPRAEATNCGPRALPPIPTQRRFLNAPALPTISPL